MPPIAASFVVVFYLKYLNLEFIEVCVEKSLFIIVFDQWTISNSSQEAEIYDEPTSSYQVSDKITS